MAHFARLNANHEVTLIYLLDDSEILDPDTGDESETIGIVKCKLAHPGLNAGGGYWKQFSVDTLENQHLRGGTPFRKNYAGIGYTYDSSRDAFIPPQPYSSWILNETTCDWEAPVTFPTTEEVVIDGVTTPLYVYWDEDNLRWSAQDNAASTNYFRWDVSSLSWTQT